MNPTNSDLTANEEKLLAIRKIEALDVDAGLKTISNMLTAYLKILGVFVKKHERDKNVLDSLAENDLVEFMVSIHGYKGALANLGALQLSEIARGLEMAALNNDRVYIDANLPAFKEGLSILASRLNNILKIF